MSSNLLLPSVEDDRGRTLSILFSDGIFFNAGARIEGFFLIAFLTGEEEEDKEEETV